MAKRESLAILQDKYNIPDCDLESLGLKPVNKMKLSTKITQSENEILTEICYRQRINRTQLMINGVNELLSDKGLIKKVNYAQYLYIESHKYYDFLMKAVNFEIEAQVAQLFKQYCSSQKMTVSQMLRAYVIYVSEGWKGDI